MDDIIEMLVLKEEITKLEYFCNSCGQLRLSFKAKLDIYGNYGGGDLIVGLVDELDK